MALAVTLALAFLSTKAWWQIIVLDLLMAATIIYGLSGWFTKGSLSLPERMGRFTVLMFFILLGVSFYGWLFRPEGGNSTILYRNQVGLPPQTLSTADQAKAKTTGFLQFHRVELQALKVTLRPGSSLSFMTTVANAGSSPVYHAYFIPGSALMRVDDPRTADRTARKTILEHIQTDESGNWRPGTEIGCGHTISDRVLMDFKNKGEISELISGKARLYVMGFYTWTDTDGGNRQTHQLCMWMDPPRTSQLNKSDIHWRACAE